jgi:hypothetical protein
MARALTAVAVAFASCQVPMPKIPPVVATTGPQTVAATTGRAAPTNTSVATTAPPPAPPAAGEVDDVWAALARCESGMRPGLRNPPYSGAFQFTAGTWRSLGERGQAADWSYEHQLAAARRLLARSGPGQWPVCGRRVGLTRVAA